MGVNTDAAGMGFPYRPTPASVANAIWDCDPLKSDVDASPDIPDTADFSLVNWVAAADSETRLGFSYVFASCPPRVWGYVASIDETNFSPT